MSDNRSHCYCTQRLHTHKMKTRTLVAFPKKEIDTVVELKTNLFNEQHNSIVCFGNKVFNTFCNYLNVSMNEIIEIQELKLKKVDITSKNASWTLYRVWHYSNYGRFAHKVDVELPKQLSFINHEATKYII